MSNIRRFSAGVTHYLGSYVYLLIDPNQKNNGGVFYVGKGRGNRVFTHLKMADQTKRIDTHRDFRKLRKIRRIGSDNVGVRILRHGLSDDEALAVEASAIDLLGLEELHNLQGGHGSRKVGLMNLWQIEAKYGATDLDFKSLGGRRIVFIKVNRGYKPREDDSEEALYAAVRHWWRVAEKRRQVGGAEAPEWAAAVYDGVVLGVYRINRWVRRPQGKDGAGQRWGFVGEVDQKLQKLLCNRSVAHWYKPGSQTPLYYVNCRKPGR
jgi:hypothetical protein